jgi:hypothetical protein
MKSLAADQQVEGVAVTNKFALSGPILGFNFRL